MSAELLSRAAEKARATAATAPSGPWTADAHQVLASDGDPIAESRYWAGGIGTGTGEAGQTAAHVALWDPEVAVAVAAWLDQHVEDHGTYDCRWEECAAVRTARALLKEDPR